MTPFSKVQSDNTTNKSFKYTKDKVTLNFNLRVDVKTELKDFLECLKAAVTDVELELTKK